MDRVYEPCERVDCPFASCMGTKRCMLPNIMNGSHWMVVEHAMRVNCDKPRIALAERGLSPKPGRLQTGMKVEDCFAHLPDRWQLELLRYVDSEVFRQWSYIFYTGKSPHQYGYCSYCKKESVASGLKHNQSAICPECGTKCTAKSSGVGRKKLVLRSYVTYYLKSAINPEAIVAIGAYVVRDYSGDFWNVETQLVKQAVYVFIANKGGTGFYRNVNYWPGGHGMETHHFRRQATLHSLWSKCNSAFKTPFYSRESIAAAVQGTPFQYSGWENYDHADMVEFFGLSARYPSVEYLTKLGFSRLVMEKIQSRSSYGVVNWRGKTILKVLKLTKLELNAIRDKRLTINFETLNNLPRAREMFPYLTPAQMIIVAKAFSFPGHLKQLQPVWESYGLNQKRVVRYLLEQVERCAHFSGVSEACIAWRDYVDDARKLGYDLRRMRLLLPQDLHAAHQETIKLVRAEKDKKLDLAIRRRVKKLKHLTFKQKELLIRPAGSMDELIAEGQALEHCVGRYGDRYASGDCIIMLVRRAEEPDTPFATVEVRGSRVTQCLGLKNKPPAEEVKRFVEAFAARKLKPKATKMKEVVV